MSVGRTLGLVAERALKAAKPAAISGGSGGFTNSLLSRVRSLAMRAAETGDTRDDLHPCALGAAVVFADGAFATAHQLKALEYGCTQDSVCQLAPAMKAATEKQNPPLILCMADQFGCCHAPFAPGRAFLVEHGLGDLRVLCQDKVGGLHTPAAVELIPGLPQWDRPLDETAP